MMVSHLSQAGTKPSCTELRISLRKEVGRLSGKDVNSMKPDQIMNYVRYIVAHNKDVADDMKRCRLNMMQLIKKDSICKIVLKKTKNVSYKLLEAMYDQCEAMCSDDDGEIERGIVMKNLDSSTHVCYAYRKDSPRYHLCGISLITCNVQKKGAELTILCSNQRYGGKILSYTENCLEELGFEYVYLHAVTDKIVYYIMQGYQFNENACRFQEDHRTFVDDDTDTILMSKCLV